LCRVEIGGIGALENPVRSLGPGAGASGQPGASNQSGASNQPGASNQKGTRDATVN
jgi:hypothetical protein